jgi:hypothetical protein
MTRLALRFASVRSMIRGIAVSVGLLAVLALAGCAPAVATPTAAPTVAQTPSATPTPVATPTQPTLAQLVVSPDGIGPLLINEPVPSESGPTAVVTWDANKCTANSPDSYRGAWLANYPETGELEISNSDRAVFTFESEQKDSPITFIAVWSNELKTANGVGIGSTSAQLTAAYGSALTVTHGQTSDLYSLRGTQGTLVFEVPTAVDTSRFHVWSSADLGSVIWMYLYAGDDAATSLLANQQAGSCFVPE